MCGPRQFLYTQSGRGKPKGWTPNGFDGSGKCSYKSDLQIKL